MPLTALLALNRGVRLTLVLGAATGIEAVRMSAGAPSTNGKARESQAS
jgi:hypothetical protein